MTRARVVHHSEYLALSLLLIGAAVWQKDQITAWFWFWFFGAGPVRLRPGALLRASARERSSAAARGVALQPLAQLHAAGGAVLRATSALRQQSVAATRLAVHISVDRLVGFGLRGDDGGQALI